MHSPTILAESPPKVKRTALRLRIPSYDDICRILEQPNPSAYFWNTVDQEWIEIPITKITPPMPWGASEEYAEKWLGFKKSSGRRVDEEYCHVYDAEGYVDLQDCRIRRGRAR